MREVHTLLLVSYALEHLLINLMADANLLYLEYKIRHNSLVGSNVRSIMRWRQTSANELHQQLGHREHDDRVEFQRYLRVGLVSPFATPLLQIVNYTLHVKIFKCK